jgi:hypothetical protein
MGIKKNCGIQQKQNVWGEWAQKRRIYENVKSVRKGIIGGAF